MQTKLDFCLYSEFDSIQTALHEIFGTSKSQMKKFGLKKNFLLKKAHKQQFLSVPIGLANGLKINPVYLGEPIKIIGEDEDFIAFSKPIKIHSHPLDYSDQFNLLSSFYSLGYEKLLAVNNANYDRGLLYRLDYETSGLMLYAKSDEIYSKVREHFSEVILQKKYLAVVSKGISAGAYSHYLAAKGHKGSIQQEDDEGELAQIDVEVIAEKDQYALIMVELKQGMRHQIRAQLKALGFPIVGDELYQGEDFKRLMLHCFHYQLNFKGHMREYKDQNFEFLNSFFTDTNKIFK